MSGAVPRVGGRVLLLDPDGRVLLIHERIDNGTTHWLTPGGGVEGDESPADAAVRETFEEVGLRVTLARPDEVLVTRREWSWSDKVFDQVDHFYLARIPVAIPPEQLRPGGLTPMEQSTVLSHAWWTVADLRDTDEVLLPADLADVLDRVVRDARPGG